MPNVKKGNRQVIDPIGPPTTDINDAFVIFRLVTEKTTELISENSR